MDVLHGRCCGLDVHKSSISACILLREAGRVQKHQRRFGAMTQDLRELAEWLRQFGVTQVAMESSGVYWKPVWNILEREFTIVLANAQHIKNVPGRKTDQKDAEWIAQLLQYGLLRPSYVPREIIRDLRDLTRMRASLSQEASRLSSRIQTVLEDANVKLASVATNVLGKSGRAMLEDVIVEKDDPEHLASLALSHYRRGAYSHRYCLSLTEEPEQLRRSWRKLLRSHPLRRSKAVLSQAAPTTRAQGNSSLDYSRSL